MSESTKRTKSKEDEPQEVFQLSLKELTESLIKQAGLHKGYFEIGFNIKFAIGSIGPNDDQLPGAAIGIGGVFLIQSHIDSPGAVDASVINPKPKRVAKSKSN